jgi:uncharacterized FlaG/YvyC family protein
MSDVIDPVVNIKPSTGRGMVLEKNSFFDASLKNSEVASLEKEATASTGISAVKQASAVLENIVNSVSDTALSFSVEGDLSRMVVAVRAVGSDEIIRQFPPEEFLTVAKFIAAQNVDELDEDFLKGILFDQYS